MYFEIYRDGPQYRWRLRGANHEIVAHGESYQTKAGCEHVIRLVKGSTNAPVYER